MSWDMLATDERVEKAKAALEANGITVLIAENGADAKAKALALIPHGAEVMTMSSVTNDAIGLNDELNASGQYAPVRDKLYAMDRKTQGVAMKKLGAAPEWAVGSVHAVTEDGHLLIASNTGSQLPAYAYGASHVVWVAGTHKIVADVEAGKRRIYEHCLPLESERAKKAYSVAASAVNKLLVIEKENEPNRLTLILVKEKLGF